MSCEINWKNKVFCIETLLSISGLLLVLLSRSPIEGSINDDLWLDSNCYCTRNRYLIGARFDASPLKKKLPIK